jgi:hypothetical protein
VRQARENAAATLPYITAARKAGATTLRQVAEALQNRGIRTPSGGVRWHAATVSYVQKMAA